MTVFSKISLAALALLMSTALGLPIEPQNYCVRKTTASAQPPQQYPAAALPAPSPSASSATAPSPSAASPPSYSSPSATPSPGTSGAQCNTYGLTIPAGFTDGMMSQWCGMVTNNVNGLISKDSPSVMLTSVEAQYKQAGISAPPMSALPDVDEIMSSPEAKAALQKTMDNYPAFGSMDNTAEDIQEVYADSIQAACSLTGIPEDMMVTIIWTESKGFPLIYQGLTQMDYIAWGQMVDANPSLKNRYMPHDNIVASAMYLANQMKLNPGLTWDECYHAHYQG